ncbi:MAG: PQQ-binding-like beta-propeller repeat protein [Deltaproteobacteria bacterium]|nr:PQQ-binding-like beta-propeller repeat protein [Deltaproteobacteria bacterium]
MADRNTGRIALILIGLIVSAATSFTPNWAMADRSSAAGGDPMERYANVPAIEWVTKIKKRRGMGRGLYQFSTPVVADDRLYVGSAGGRVVCVELRLGKRLWSIDTEGPVVGPLRLAGEQLYFGDAKGILYAVQAADGSPIWRVDLGGEVMAAPLVVGTAVYAVTMHGELVSVDRATGARKWRTARRVSAAQFTVKGMSNPALLDGGRIAIGYPDGVIAVHDAVHGTLMWEQRLSAPAAMTQDVETTPLPLDGLLVVGTIDGIVAALDGRDGDVVWKAELGTPNDLAVADGIIYAAGSGRVAAIDGRRGQVLWTTRLPVGETSAPAVVGEALFVTSLTDRVYLLDRRTGAMLGKRHLGSGSYGHPVAAGDRVYVITNHGNLVALKVP